MKREHEAKRALVTGASEGLGRAFARRLEAEGYRVAAVARNETRLKDLMRELGGDAHSYVVADLSTREGVERISTMLAQSHYDLLVNNAGAGQRGPFHQADLAALQRMIRLNCEAVVALSHAFLWSAKSGDSLVNVSGLQALLPIPGMGAYRATKSFIMSFSEALWAEQKDRGVYVMGLCPGATATDFLKKAGAKEGEGPPAAITQSPDEVVDRAMKTLKKRAKSTVIASSRRLMLLAAISRLLPRNTVARFMAFLASRT